MRTTLAIWLLLGLVLPAAVTADQPPLETYDLCDEVPHDAEGRPVPAALRVHSAVPPDVTRRPDPTEWIEEVADAQR
jgi:hypothetical protein